MTNQLSFTNEQTAHLQLVGAGADVQAATGRAWKLLQRCL